jgi:glycosyltransferase involved in cell wall biosynthesis
MTFTCIIPFFNERDRILKVLDAVVNIKEIDEIICANDGSTDGTAEIVKQHYPHLLIVHNKKNLGKTAAVKAALQRAKGTHILLLDADLQNLQSKGIENAISAIKKDKTIDMIILRRVNAQFIVKNRFFDVLLCGQRVVKKDDLLKTLSLYKPKGYELEIALNQYMLDKHKNVYWMPLYFVNTWSTKKMGVIKGIYKMFHMSFGVSIGYVGLYNTLKQLLFFCRKEYQTT